MDGREGRKDLGKVNSPIKNQETQTDFVFCFDSGKYKDLFDFVRDDPNKSDILRQKLNETVDFDYNPEVNKDNIYQKGQEHSHWGMKPPFPNSFFLESYPKWGHSHST